MALSSVELMIMFVINFDEKTLKILVCYFISRLV